jgi:hypothetical protein
MTPITIDIETAASSLGISTTALRGYIDAGLLPVVKFPSTRRADERSRRVLIAVEDLQAFVAAHRVTGAGR